MSTATSLSFPSNDEAQPTTLSSDITSSTTTIGVGDIVSTPSTPYLALLAQTNGKRELVKVTGEDTATNNLTVTRGSQSTTAKSFSSGDKVFLGVQPASVLDDLNIWTDDGDGSISYPGRIDVDGVVGTGDGLFEIKQVTIDDFQQAKISISNTFNGFGAITDDSGNTLTFIANKNSNSLTHLNDPNNSFVNDVSHINTLTQNFQNLSLPSKSQGLFIDPNGDFLYKNAGQTLKRLDMSTSYDVTTASETQTLDLSSFVSDITIVDMTFKLDGTKFYIISNNPDKIFQFDLSTAWDLSSNVTQPSEIGARDTQPFGMTAKADGAKFFNTGDDGSGGATVVEHTLSTAWDLSSKTSEVENSIGSQPGANPQGIDFFEDGETMWISDLSNSKIHHYELSTPWDTTTATHTNQFDSTQRPRGLHLKKDTNGRIWTTGDSPIEIQEHLIYNTRVAFNNDTSSFEIQNESGSQKTYNIHLMSS